MNGPVEKAESKSIRILFNSKKCIHSRACVLSRPDVFVPNVEGAWLHPELATPQEIEEIAHNCPSGAIQYERLDGGSPETPPKVNLVRIRENGPLAFYGELEIKGHESTFRATLCRCGASKNKPYCDSSHAAAGFKASGEASPVDSPTLATRNGKVQINPAANGPLLVSGAIEVVTGTGKTILKTTSTAFCRCGASANKPYCDGTHAKIGFKSES
jgi:CDGSH-type Zn-finger protein/uncharacterized Fe-S cluster protein YjdI